MANNKNKLDAEVKKIVDVAKTYDTKYKKEHFLRFQDIFILNLNSC